MVDHEQARRWGIQAHYADTGGHERSAPDEVVEQVLATLRGGGEPHSPGEGALTFVPLGSRDLPPGPERRSLLLEDGTDLGPVDRWPEDLPIGYHALVDDEGDATRVAVHPRTCHRPDDLRGWGWSLQVYADRSADSWGIGDLADARTIGRWTRQRGGHAHLLINPLHAPNLGDDPQASPYYASSRCFRNPLALRIEEVAAAGEPTGRVDLADLAEQGRRLNADRLIDRQAVWALKRTALERLWAAPGHDEHRRRAESVLSDDPVALAFAGFGAALEEHGPRWDQWPADLRHPSGSGWSRFRVDHADRLAFHAWLQLLVDDQVSALQAEIGVIQDLAVGTDPDGFDAWYWQDLFVLDGTRIGAPADQFNTQGQDWGLPPMDPWRLRAAGYEPFVRMLRSALAVGAGLRIDHVMGLFRLFWIPPGRGAADGLYVRQPSDDLLALIALESSRAGAFVVGEDLGTVEHGVREALAAHHVLTYRVMSLDDTPVEHYPHDSLASVSTHDLATVAGLWSGSDLADQQRLELDPPVADIAAARQALGRQAGAGDDATVDDVVLGAHRRLAQAASRLVVAQLDDAALVAERPNMPGTTDAWPNWCLALPHPIEQILDDPLTAAVADATRGSDTPNAR